MEKYDKRRWLVLIASCVINFFIGTLYVWSVFSGPMAEYLSAKNGVELIAEDLGIVFSIGNSVGFITMIAGGFITAKLGSKLVVLVGGILFGLGFVICGFASGVGGLIVGYGLFTGLAMGLVYGVTINNTVKFFPDKKGFAGGVATAAYGVSSVVWPPIVQSMIEGSGVTSTFKIVGVMTIVVIVVMSFLITKCPDGYAPKGWTPKAAATTVSATENKNWKQMITSKFFYIMMAMLFAGALSGMMMISSAKPIGMNMMGFEPAFAALLVSIIALFNALARIGGGFVSDKLGRINTLLIVFIVSIVALVCLFFGGQNMSVPLFIIGIILTGICFGCFMGIYPGFTMEMFGAKNQGVNYGIMFIGFSLAGLIAPMIVKSVYGSTGTYLMAFLIAIIVAAVGFVLSLLFKAMAKKAK